MPEEEIHELIEAVANNAKRLMERDGKLTPTALVVAEKELMPLELLFRDSEDKYRMYFALGLTLKKVKQTIVILINDVALRHVDKKDAHKFKDNKCDPTEQPTTYPESMRQDGIFIQEIDVTTKTMNAYLMRYENRKDERFWHPLEKLNKDGAAMSGAILDSVVDGYECDEEIVPGIGS